MLGTLNLRLFGQWDWGWEFPTSKKKKRGKGNLEDGYLQGRAPLFFFRLVQYVAFGRGDVGVVTLVKGLAYSALQLEVAVRLFPMGGGHSGQGAATAFTVGHFRLAPWPVPD